VVLLSDAVIALHRDGTVSRLFHIITMLHGDQDLAEWDEVTRDYDRRNSLETICTSRIHLSDGTTINAQRTESAVDPSTRILNLTFIPLKPGAVLEFESQFDRFTPFEIAPGVWSQMFLQGLEPRRRVRFVVAVAEPYQVDIKLHHCDWQPLESEEFGYRVYRWDLHDVPGIEMDQWTPPLRDFLPWVDVTTLHSWNPIAKHYMQELEPPAIAPYPVKKLVKELTAEAKTTRDKAQAIYCYATRDVRYGRHPQEVALEAPREPSKMLKDLRGDCKDKSALMVSMFRELDIPAKIALVQTRINGEAPSLPAPWFDHALVRTEVDGRELWLDAAGGPYTFGEIPYNDQGIEALILDGEDSVLSYVPMATSAQHQSNRVCRGRLAEDGTYRFDARVTACGEEAVGLRLQCLDRSEEHRERILAQTAAVDLTGAEVSGTKFSQLEDLTQDVCYEYSLTLNRWGRCIEDILLLRIPWAQPAQTTGPLSAASRVQPLAAPGVLGVSESHEIEIPPGFAGYGLPYLTKKDCDWGTYACSVRVDQTRFICKRQVEYRGGIVPPKRFGEFKDFWEVCARADAADVVLMKTKSQ